MIAVEQVDFIGIPVLENAAGDAWLGDSACSSATRVRASAGSSTRRPTSRSCSCRTRTPADVRTGRCPSPRSPCGGTTWPPNGSDWRRTGVEFVGDTFDSSVCNGAAFTRARRQRHAPAPPLRAVSGRPHAGRAERTRRLRRRADPGPRRGRTVLRRDARARAIAALERRVGGVRGRERHPRARAARVHRQAVRAAARRDDRPPRRGRPGARWRSSRPRASSSPPA